MVCPKQGLLALTPESLEWFAWLATQSAFRFIGRQGRFTAHHEVLRVPNGAWRAHRHIRNHSYTLRLGLTQDLTLAVLEHAAATLQAHLMSLLGFFDASEWACFLLPSAKCHCSGIEGFNLKRDARPLHTD